MHIFVHYFFKLYILGFHHYHFFFLFCIVYISDGNYTAVPKKTLTVHTACWDALHPQHNVFHMFIHKYHSTVSPQIIFKTAAVLMKRCDYD